MAIYKPSNCTPFLSAKDLTQPFNISCELNTSNERVTGYKLKILDSLNNTIFEGKQFDPITSENTGLNGSVLTLPVLVTVSNNQNHNTIYYYVDNDKKNHYQDCDGTNISNFYNGYPNQPYKWIITLAQGQEKNEEGALEQLPTNSKYFDMAITSGTVLGSTPNRIQSYLSENIQKDYFIQLYNKLTFGEIGKRVLISSYDRTCGYIYPQEGKLQINNFNESVDYFQIYKFSNDPDVVSASSKVVLKTDTKMQNIKFESKTASEVWGTGSETYPYYFTQKYTGFASKPNIGSFPCNEFDSSASGDLIVGSTIIVSGEDQQKYNGVFTLQSFKVDEVKTKNGYTETTTYNITVQWLRAATADTWAELVNNVYLVQLGTYANRRFQVQVGENETGTINVNNVVFVPEEPIELYSDENLGFGKNKKKGIIFKNNKIENKDEVEIFIRPFEGVVADQNIYYTAGDAYKTNAINKIDKVKWSVIVNETLIPTADVDEYKITSFFKSSEENPFYAYADPTVEITSEKLETPEDGTIYKVKNRFIKLNGIFSQDNNKSWVYYQWRMTDLTIGTETITEKGFDGEIAWTIFGLQNNHYYQVELYIQDEFERVASKEITFQVQVEILEKKPFFEVEFDCETNSYKINTTSTGVVIPGLENKILTTKILNDETNYQFFTVQEEQTGDFVTHDGAEVRVTGPFEAIRDLVVDLGGDPNFYNCVLLKAEKDGTPIDNYNSGYNYNPEDNSYSLYVTDLESPATATSSGNLFFYNKMKGDSGGEFFISAPKNDTITINFSNILNNYFEGQVMSYHIGVDSPSTAFNDIEVRVSVTPETITPKATKLKEVSPDRNKIKVEIWQCNKQNNTHTPQSKIREKEFVFYGNPNTRKICSPWVDPARGAASPNCDYIETDVVYDKDGKKIEGGININGEGRYNSNSEISEPITLTKSIENPNTYAVWYDMETGVVEQADETAINYFGNYWNYFDKAIYYKNINLKLDGNENNLWTFTNKTVKLSFAGPSTKRLFEEDTYYYPLAENNYSGLGDVQLLSVDKNYIFITSSGGYGVARKFNCTPGQTYTLSVQEANGDAYVMYFQEDGTYIPKDTGESRRLINSYSNIKSGNFTIPENCAWFAIQLRLNDNVPFDNYWNDQTNSESPIYRQTSINLPDDGHTGEEIFTNKNLTFSLILSDYNTATKQFAPLEINGKLWNGDEEVLLTDITK